MNSILRCGTVDENGDPRVSFQVKGPGGVSVEVSAILDTGFGGAIALPQRLVDHLGLRQSDRGYFTLADGSMRELAIFAAEIGWLGKWRRHEVIAMGDGPLVRMALLRGRRLELDAVEGGAVRVGPIPAGK